MSNLNQIFLVCILLFSSITQTIASITEDFPIIPLPLKISPSKGVFEISPHTLLVYQSKELETGKFLNQIIESKIGKLLKVGTVRNVKTNNIAFKKDNAIQFESYILSISPKQIVIRYSDENGAFYAVQSLIQLIMANNDISSKRLKIHAAVIEDRPAFGYRGLMLDLARYYMPISAIKKYIELMASYKMNNLHLHLTDDQGWRIEIKKYPKLHEVAAWRKESIVGHKNDTPRVYDGIPHGGFYTQNELKDLVAFAEKRFVTIIPEIEMPGHSSAALAAYPELACVKKDYDVSVSWGIHKDVLCPNDFTFQFLQDVLTEVIAIFPSKNIHIGGDECPKDRWKACKNCQELIVEKGLVDEDGLQNYFMKRVGKFLTSKGKQAVSWDWEGAHASSEPNDAIMMSWQGEDAGIKAAKRKEYTIMTPHLFTYLDYYQTKERFDGEPLSIAGFLPIEKVYSYQPIPDALNDIDAQFVLGVQGCLWSEYIPNEKTADYKLFPRLIALAEVAWSTKENRNYESFTKRLKINTKILDQKKINYYKN